MTGKPEDTLFTDAVKELVAVGASIAPELEQAVTSRLGKPTQACASAAEACEP